MYPYLLRGLTVERVNHVWAMDITNIPKARGFVYLAAVMGWFSRQVLAWRLSIGTEVYFRLNAVPDTAGRRPSTPTREASSPALRSLGYWRRRGCHQHGRPWGLARQCLPRAALAFGQVRGGVSTRYASVGEARASMLSELLQSREATFEPRRADAGPGLLRRFAAGRGGMKFAAVGNNRQTIHLLQPKRCTDEPGHL
jgi:hypothetical protein